MRTTSLFVELVIIGIGASTWVALLLVAAFGYHWIPLDLPLSLLGLVPLLAVVYLLGIITDRFADSIFRRLWDSKAEKRWFEDRADYIRDRQIVLTRSESLSDLLQYGRSRLRICRGWTLNSLLILLALNLLVWTRFPTSPQARVLALVGSTALLLLAVGSWFAWSSLSDAEHRKVKEHAAFLVGNDGTAPDDI